jgi:hypothetical protein
MNEHLFGDVGHDDGWRDEEGKPLTLSSLTEDQELELEMLVLGD